MSFRIILVGVFLGCSVFVSSANAGVDANAGVVLLRKSCTEGGVALNNCFTDIPTLFNWIAGTRLPTQAAPLAVQIGPGTFSVGSSGSIGFSDVSLIGSGRDKTTIGTSSGNALDVHGSQRLHFQNLRVTGGFPAPVYWHGGGSSTWVNVQIDGGIYGWSETNCELTTKASRPVHKWFSSTVTSHGKVAYASQCSENWFYGSELIITGAGDGSGIRGFTAHAGNGQETISYPEAHLYGSIVRVIPDADISFPPPSASGDGVGVVAIAAGQNAVVHVHNTAIDVVGNNMPNDVAALAAINGGMIHGNQNSYNLSSGQGGHIVRIVNEGGHIHAPYLWEHIPGTPLISKSGADITTITSGTSDGQPHLIIYSENCASTWYDSVDKICMP